MRRLVEFMRSFKSSVNRLLKNKQFWVLLFILGLGAYFRLWNIYHLFNILGDYDEGSYSLASRFISEGLLPYRDIAMVHPPLFNLILAAVYKIFGYNFFYGKYLSVFFSLASIIVIYFTGKKIRNSGTGLLAAALFAVSPDMVYWGRRIVQEASGIFWLLLAVYFVVDYLNNGKRSRLIFSGLFLGLAVATKYTFIPAAIAVLTAIVVILMGERFWTDLKKLAGPFYLVGYFVLLGCEYALLLALYYLTNLQVPIPFFNMVDFSFLNLIILIVIFILPLTGAVLIKEKEIHFKEWLLGLGRALRKKEVWYCLGGILAGYFAVTGYFWIRAPQVFITQTFTIQGGRSSGFPSLVAVIQSAVADASFVKMALFSIVLAIPLAMVILNKNPLKPHYIFLATALVFTIIFCQYFAPTPRYYVAVYPLFLIGLAGLVPLDISFLRQSFSSLQPSLKTGILSITAVLLLFLSTSVVILTNYTVYDTGASWFMYDEEQVYKQTDAYLESQSPHLVYAVNPIFIALSDKIPSTRNFDTFVLLYLEKKDPGQIIREDINTGVDYVVIGAWEKHLAPRYQQQAYALIQAVKNYGELVKIIAPDSVNRTEIYKVN